jgi:hypothetical protein
MQTATDFLGQLEEMCAALGAAIEISIGGARGRDAEPGARA